MRSWLRILVFLLIGLAAGAGLGLYMGWVAWPTEFTDANPTVLQETYKRDYLQMIATVYDAEGDLDAARSRVASLGSSGSDVLYSYVIDTILQAEDDTEIRRLVKLASDLGLYSPVMDPYLEFPAAEPADG